MSWFSGCQNVVVSRVQIYGKQATKPEAQSSKINITKSWKRIWPGLKTTVGLRQTGTKPAISGGINLDVSGIQFSS